MQKDVKHATVFNRALYHSIYWRIDTVAPTSTNEATKTVYSQRLFSVFKRNVFPIFFMLPYIIIYNKYWSMKLVTRMCI